MPSAIWTGSISFGLVQVPVRLVGATKSKDVSVNQLNKWPLGRIIVRSRERLVAIRPLDGMLVIETMRYADEVLPRDELLSDDDVELTDRERAMARQLVESLAVDAFQPEKFHDE